MNQNRYSDKIWELIIKELSDEATLQEQQMLEKWLAEKPQHLSFYENLKEIWTAASNVKLDNSHQYNYERGLNRLRTKISEEEKTKSKSDQLAVPLDKRKTPRSAWMIAASILLVITSVSVFVTVQFWQKPVVKYSASETERKKVDLPDGSEVYLNKNSEIELSENFTADVREVTLDGEAFFEIKKDEGKSFKIYFDSGTVEVLGTSLNVKEVESNGETMVAVKEGLVSFSNNRTKEVKLSAGQLGVLNHKNNSISIEDTDTQNYFSWLDGNISFREMPFAQVCTQLERIYDINCQLRDESLNDLKLTAHTENLQLENILNTITISLGIKYQKNDDTIVWRK